MTVDMDTQQNNLHHQWYLLSVALFSGGMVDKKYNVFKKKTVSRKCEPALIEQVSEWA